MNKVILLGRLTKDPETRATPSGHTVCNFSLAVNRNYSKGEERQADFINIVAWNRTADFCKNYFKKGQQIALVGRIQTRNWDDADGKRHYATDVVADEVFFADKRRDSESEDRNNSMPTPPTFNDNNTVMDFIESDDIPF